METKSNFWQRLGIQDWFLTNETSGINGKTPPLTPDTVYSYIIEKFKDSIKELSFGQRVVFYHEFIISFNAEDYREFVENKQGIFGLIVQETVKKFYEILKEQRALGKTVEPSGSKWVFRLVSHPDYVRGDKGFIGKLLPDNNDQKAENLRVTFIPRQTGIAQTFDVNNDVLKGFTYYSEGYMEIPYEEELEYIDQKNAPATTLARLETIIPDKQFAGKKVEYLMKDDDIIISGSDETREEPNIFVIPSEWVNSPHLQIKYNKADGKFYLASFGEITTLNEGAVKPSGINNPEWVELPVNSRLLLNGIIGVNLFKS
ncbi:hypothetical protein EOD41_18870 [Mucilaginibacter limnophilus]|uniref:Uncharacterized protein n=1 Tax=Mucilaginibacter limnophilus TaxID=1932778 RepID=A0A437MI96_9SPHI|nr:hypothetical protein [Mucilaginibacter limnophilus]RVT97359.1 hypothetical protein EOD41_18870 [Mucilaginibacter limnophilus]